VRDAREAIIKKKQKERENKRKEKKKKEEREKTLPQIAGAEPSIL